MDILTSESEIQTEFETEVIEEQKNVEVCSIIFKVKNSKFNIDSNPYDIKLFGKRMIEYVENAVFDTEIVYGECEFLEDILQKAKNLANPNSKYTFVLFSDTPLFRHKTFLQIKEYFEMKNLLGLKLTRGYVFQTKYLMNLNSLQNLQMQYFEEEDFVTCSNLKQVAFVSDILKNRILDFYMKSGVIIKDPATTYIDAEANIEPNVVIEPHNLICGNTIIEKNVHLKYGNKLEDAIICENSTLENAVIKNSMICKNCMVGYGAIVQNKSKICENVSIPPYSHFDGVVVNKDDKLSSFVTYRAEEN